MQDENQMDKCTLYIDESGDLGLNRGSRWFVITGTIVDEKNEPEIRSTIQSIRKKWNLNEIHMRKIYRFYEMGSIVNDIRELPFTTINIIMDTTKGQKKSPNLMYNFLCRLLLERYSWYLRDNNLRGDVVLSSRGTEKDNDLISYINNMKLRNDNKIDASRIGKVCSHAASEWDVLQLADICATSMFKSHEIKHECLMPCFMLSLSDHIYRYRGRILKYGIKYLEDDMQPNKQYFTDNEICRTK